MVSQCPHTPNLLCPENLSTSLRRPEASPRGLSCPAQPCGSALSCQQPLVLSTAPSHTSPPPNPGPQALFFVFPAQSLIPSQAMTHGNWEGLSSSHRGRTNRSLPSHPNHPTSSLPPEASPKPRPVPAPRSCPPQDHSSSHISTPTFLQSPKMGPPHNPTCKPSPQPSTSKGLSQVLSQHPPSQGSLKGGARFPGTLQSLFGCSGAHTGLAPMCAVYMGAQFPAPQRRPARQLRVMTAQVGATLRASLIQASQGLPKGPCSPAFPESSN